MQFVAPGCLDVWTCGSHLARSCAVNRLLFLEECLGFDVLLGKVAVIYHWQAWLTRLATGGDISGGLYHGVAPFRIQERHGRLKHLPSSLLALPLLFPLLYHCGPPRPPLLLHHLLTLQCLERPRRRRRHMLLLPLVQCLFTAAVLVFGFAVAEGAAFRAHLDYVTAV